ncbi:unnamed protein product, partial [Choristocarpus tenellus]
METIQELELAVLYACNPPGVGEEAAVVKAQATRYCDEVKQSPDGWQVALQMFATTSRPEARFFSLGVLQEALGARAGVAARVTQHENRRVVREVVINWLRGVGPAGLQAQELFVKTKVAVVLALLVKHDYPEVWRDAFMELEGLLQGGTAYVDVYLRILGAIDDEVVTFHVDRSPEEVEHNCLIKDTMRSTTAISSICRVIYEVISTYRVEMPRLAAFALETLSRYIGWIELAQVVNDRFLPLFGKCLESGEEQLVQQTCGCIMEVVNK